MNRNTDSRFANVPSVSINRSKFDRGASVKTSFNVGELIPFYVDEVLPGDTMSVKTSKVLRMPALITPIMDNIALDTYYFFCPNRLVWSHWKELMGENTQSAWIPQATYSVPQVEAPSGGWEVGTIADYMGIPTDVDDFSVNALPFRMYALIVNEWFASEAVNQPANVPVDDNDITGNNGTNYVTDLVKGGKPFIVNKLFDWYTAGLPTPQKGPDVAIPIADVGNFPVYATSDFHDWNELPKRPTTDGVFKNYPEPIAFFTNYATDPEMKKLNVTQLDSNGRYQAYHSNSPYDSIPLDQGKILAPANLWAINPGAAQMASINELRMAFQVQKLYERDARSGTRYREILAAHFNVRSPDARMQIPEYLGGNRINLRISQVLQQSETGSTPQGTPTGVSMTIDSHGDFSKSFVEHGFLIGVMCARYKHSYSQGLLPMWTRKDRLDYYFPVLANIGEQALKNKNIYLQGDSVVDSDGEIIDDQVFAYQEAWSEYRYKPDTISGQMRSTYAQSLDVWHLGDDYNSLPSLSAGWLQEDKSIVDRVLTVGSSVTNQIFADIYIDNVSTRPMPFYSVPGLIDHH